MGVFLWKILLDYEENGHFQPSSLDQKQKIEFAM